MRRRYEQELERIQDQVLMLGSMVTTALCRSVTILRQKDSAQALALMAEDQAINERRYAIEADCLRVIATQQPVAGDIRFLAAVLEIATELERMGDYAKGIGKITLLLGSAPRITPPAQLLDMCQQASRMLDRALVAFIHRDVEAAWAIPKEDDILDDIYNQIQEAMIQRIGQDPGIADQANHLLWAAHNLERAGDRVTNICERIIFTVTGELVEMDMLLDEIMSDALPDALSDRR